MNIYYVYQLVNPRSSLPFYIGRGKGARAWSHLTFQSRTHNPHKDRKIRKIQSLGLKVGVEMIAESLTFEESIQIESATINRIGLDNLTNICPDANPPRKCGVDNSFYGRTHSKESKEKMGNANRGKDLKSPAGKHAISESLVERWKDVEYRNKMIEILRINASRPKDDKFREACRQGAVKRIAAKTFEQRSEISKRGQETKKVRYENLRRQLYIDDDGKKRFMYVDRNTGQVVEKPNF